MHSLNGLMYGNGPSLRIAHGTVRWYIMGMGEKEHVLRFVGHTLDGMRVVTEMRVV
jgi:hypothetical protein